MVLDLDVKLHKQSLIKAPIFSKNKQKKIFHAEKTTFHEKILRALSKWSIIIKQTKGEVINNEN